MQYLRLGKAMRSLVLGEEKKKKVSQRANKKKKFLQLTRILISIEKLCKCSIPSFIRLKHFWICPKTFFFVSSRQSRL